MSAGGCARRSVGHPDGCSDPVVQQVAETQRASGGNIADAALPTISATITSCAGVLWAGAILVLHPCTASYTCAAQQLRALGRV